MPGKAAELVFSGEASLRLPSDLAGAGLGEVCLHQLFEGRADAEPAVTALVDGRTRISYRELERSANRLAHRLRELGAGPEVRVAVCLERTPELVATLLAVLKSGAAYVPIDPGYPMERQTILLADSRPEILVTQEHLLRRLPETAAAVLCVDRDRKDLEQRSDVRPANTAGPSNLAYFIYTSGSTGRPKAVSIEHRSAVALVPWSARMFPREELAGVLASTSICFDMSVYEIFVTLALGGTLILAENALALPSLPAAREVTLVNTVPSAAAELVRSGGLPASVRVVNLGGEPLRRALVDRLYDLEHIEKVYNLYGPSEDTTYSTWALMRRGDALSPSIGVPLDGSSVYLLDPEMRQVEAGQEGELYLGGAGLARGYFDRPELTAQRFVPSPFAQTPGERLYTTGDLARLRRSGELDCLGRLDHQVKIRGFRVELGEIEALLERFPGVADAVVVARELEGEDVAVEKVLVAYVVPASGIPLQVASLRAYLQASLLEAMVPAYFVELPELPLSPNGKVDRKALPAPDFTSHTRSYVQPRTPVEEALAEIWGEVFGLPQIGIEDDFFALGGHSLLATRVLSRVRRTLSVELSQRALFENPTIAGLARTIADSAGGLRPDQALEATNEQGKYPLSYSQRQLWLLDRLAPGSPVYNVPVPLCWYGDFSPAVLIASLAAIVRRHQVLRTTYAAGELEPYQVVRAADLSSVPVVDLAELPENLRHGESRRLAREEAGLPFDLENGPILRAVLLRLEAAEHHLLLDFHHIAFDGWSVDVLIRELAGLYNAAAAGKASGLNEPTWQYRDFAAWQRRRFGGDALAGQMRFWRLALEGAPDFFELPTDHLRPPVQSFRGAALRFRLTADLSTALRRLGRERGATLFMLMLAAYQTLLRRTTGQHDLLVGTPVAGRNRTEIEELIGCFVNTLAIRSDFTGDPGFAELLARVRERCLAAYAHQELPFELLVEELRPERDLSRRPLVQVTLAVENASPMPHFAGLRLMPLEVEVATAQFDLELNVREAGDAFVVTFTWSTDLFDAPTVARLAAHFETLLQGIVADVERPLSRQPLLRAAEGHQLLVEWNDNREAEPRNVLELFAARVTEIPQAVALELGDERLTYAELDRRANQLAHRLRRLGVGPETPVGLFAERSAEMVIALLAIWKAGGAFLPLDPGYPKARLAFLIEDSQAKVIAAGAGLAEALPSNAAKVVGLAEEELAAESGRPPAGVPGSGDLAYLIYTSGTTGQPKAVQVEHGQLAAVLAAAQASFGFAAGDRMPCLAAFSFDIFLFELLGMLLAGGTSVLLPLRPALDLERLVDELSTATRLHAVPALMRQIVELARSRGTAAPTLRDLFTGGDAVPAELLSALRETFPQARVWVLYGPTEAAIICTSWLVPGEGPARSLLGRTLMGVEILICDTSGTPVPVGVPGEIWIGGAGVARGYWQRQELTAEKFVAIGDRRYFRSGDLGRRLADGTLEFMGRTDQQVKVRGFRIELGEVENALSSHPGVKEAVVLALPDPAGGNRLVAYVAGVALPGASELRLYLEDRLPKHMVPWGFVALESLPLTANGKVDRRALAKLEPAAEHRERLAPRTPVEEALTRIWADLLGIPAVGVDDDFFELGGHSLLAMQALSRVRWTFGVELASRTLFEHATVAGLARAVEAAHGKPPSAGTGARSGEGQPARGIRRARRDQRLPLSFPQGRLYFLDQLAPGSAAYNIAYPLRIEGALEPGALEAALCEIVRRHEVLRTTFAAGESGEPFQVIAPTPDSILPSIDLSGLPAEAARLEAGRRIADDAHRPFDLSRGPVLRFALLRLGQLEHLLLFSVHHIAFDRWSNGVLLDELAALYRAAVEGRPSPLAALDIQYADFAVWQRAEVAEGGLVEQLAYWRQQLAAAATVLELPTDHPRSPGMRWRGGARSAALPAPAAELRALARRDGATPFMLMLAAFSALLHRYTGMDDLLVGSPIANRNRVEIERLIGFFVNTLVLRADLSGDPSFGELLRQSRDTSLEAFSHQDLPFDVLVEELRPERDPSRSPLAQVMLLVETEEVLPQPPGLWLTRVDAGFSTARFDLTLAIVDAGEVFQAMAEYPTELFEAATIDRLMAHFGILLKHAAASPATRLSDLPLLESSERHQLLTEWNDPAEPSGESGCAHDLVAVRARRAPEAVALVQGGERLTYGELIGRVDRLAGHLRSLGVSAEVPVAVAAERSSEMVVGLLGVLAAGGAYVPLDPAYPQERLAFMLEDCAAPVLLTQSHLLAALPPFGGRIVTLDAELPEADGSRPLAEVDPETLAYVIYTSGSTGRPKGVQVAHRGLSNLIASQIELFDLRPGRRALQFASFSFDASVSEIFTALVSGAELHLADREELLPGPGLGRLIRERGITTATLTPSTLAAFSAAAPGEALESLATLVVAGEACPADIADRWSRGRRFINAYGPTEITVCATAEIGCSGGPPTIGRPIANTRLVLLDGELNEAPAGVEGEIAVGGVGVARGYLGRPDLTAERFMPDPSGEEPGARLYRTGDRGRILPDGRLEFRGRIDQQVKIRGFRIEPGEIEAALVRLPSLREAAVIPREDGSGEQRLVAYVAAAAGEPPTAGELRSALLAELPGHMIPSAFVLLPALPITANGKIDRRALAKLPVSAELPAAEIRAPRTSAEEVLAGIWSEIFGRQVGVEDNFFEIGGHSLLATRAISQVREALGIELPVRRLFELPTIAGLAREVEAALSIGGGVEAPRLEPMPRSGPLPLSFSQRRLWLVDQLSPGSAVYNIPYGLSLEGRLDIGALAAALTEIVRRHEVLRTAFPSLDGEPYQEIAPLGSYPLPIVDLQGLETPAGYAEAAALLAKEGERPFDLRRVPLIRTLLVRLAPERHALLVTMHHIVSDGWSIDVLLRELGELYEAFAAGRPSPLPPLPVQYADFALWQRRWLSGEALSRQLDYWREHLAGAPAGLDLPTDLPRPAVQTFNGATRSAELSGELKAFCRREGVTLFMLLLAGFDVLLARYSGQLDVLVGSPIANRNRTETEGLIGFFVNTLVFRADLAAAVSFRELLRQVRESAFAAYGSQDLPFEILVEELKPERDLSRSPFFQVVLSVEAGRRDPPTLPGLEASAIELSTGTAKFDLSLFVADAGSALAALVEYNTALYEGPTIRRLLGHLERLLEGAMSDAERGWRDLPLLARAEREQLLMGFNDSGSTGDREVCLHELFEAQVRNDPGREALVTAEGARLSYGELDHRAERLARRLRALGFGREMMAGVLLDRSADLIVTLLAVLKAGGAYAPLDPGYPQQRVLLMLETSRAAVLVSRRRLAASFGSALPQGLRMVHLEPGWEEEPEEGGPEPLRRQALPENLAYVIFTSGSTGVPKGVAIQHRSAVAMIRWARTVYGPEDYGGMLASTSICFDMSVFEIFATLGEGGKILLADNALALPELPAKEEVVVVDTVPSAMAELLRLGRLPASIRTVNLGGEPLKGTLVEEIYAKLPDVERVINLYGPSEDTTFTSYSVVPRGAAHPLIGWPVAGEAAYVLDGEMRPVPIGIPGALYVGGDGVTRGYLFRPELTAERYVPNPYGEPGSRLYRVGDLVRVLPTGELDFLGRLDHQVKVRGFRIELGEIESALSRHGRVKDAAVLALPEAGGGNRLVAYVETDSTTPALPGELRSFLKQSLPDYMVPSQFVLLSELPLTPNGKIDRRALAATAGESEDARGETRAPRSHTEEVLTGVWSEVFGRRVGVDEDFFELGGHSLLATRVIWGVQKAFGIELPLRRVFEQPTIAELAAGIEALLGTGGVLEAPPVQPIARTGPLSLSSAQRRLWFLDQLTPGSPVYNIPLPLRLLGALDIGALARALSEVVRRHESLRTTFTEMDGEPRQIIAPPRPVTLPLIDLSGLPEENRDEEARRLLAAESRRPFDLAAGPLLHTALLRLTVTAAAEHWLLLTLHHVIADGWSVEIVVRELLQIYEAFAGGRCSPLSEPEVQYADFAAWQRHWLSGAALSGQLEYWRRRLAGVPASLELPTDRPRPPVQSHRGALVTAEVPSCLASDLRSFCRREGVSVFMAALAGLDTLLYRYTGQRDLAVGSVVANRRRAETAGMVGFFINTLVLRADLAVDPTFEALLEQVREAALGAYAHQDLPFEVLAEELQPERDLSRTPFFQVALNVQSDTGSRALATGLRAEPLHVDIGTAKFDLTVTVIDAEPFFALDLEYATDLFDPPTAERLLRHFVRLLEGAIAMPGGAVSELPLLSAGERAQLMAEWTDTAALPAADLCLHQLFEIQAAHTPDAVALVSPDGTQRLTYRELERRAEMLAQHLRSLGVGPEVLAGVLMDRTVELIVSLLAVLKAGGAYVPIDPAYPRHRVAFLLESSRAAVLLTRRPLLADFAGSLPPAALPVLLDAGWEADARSDRSTGAPPSPRNLAYIIYTSGSTGEPKGVAIEHRSAVTFARWAREVFSPEERACVLGSTSICFDISIMEIFVTLAWGGKILLAENALALPTLPARDELTMINAVPSAMAELVRSGRLPDSVRTVNVGGEAVKGSLARRIYEQSRAERVVNVYGPSEDTTYSTTSEIPRDVENPAVGRPVMGSRLYILDPALRPVPVGIAGAVYLAGEGLARGYLGRPDLTAERFLPDPCGEAGARLYRVGDLARWRPDGEVDYLGRIDHQVKVRGFRIELGEIEAALVRHSEVREAAVLALPEPGGAGNRLAAFVVPADGFPPADGLVAELRSALKATLPEYMVPTSYSFLAELPLTPNGKLDRLTLERRTAEAEAAAVDEGNGVPRTAVEEVLAGIWADVFERPVGIRDDFFDLGGHSLLAVRVASRVRAVLNVELPLQKFFAAPNVAALAAIVEREIASLRGVPLPPILPAPRDRELPLSFAQQRLWLLHSVEPENPVFNLPAPLRLAGSLDVPALAAALREIVGRHESLRTVFAEREGKAFQIVHSAADVVLPVADLGGLPADRREMEARRLSEGEARLPFELSRGPLVRMALLRLAPEDHVLLVTMHHIVTDGWSTSVFARELSALYLAAATGEPSPLPELPLQYPDFAVWQRQALDGEAMANLLARWTERFGNELPVLRLPTDRPRPTVQTNPGGYCSAGFPPDQAQAVRDLARSSGTTLFMTLLAAFQALLARYSQQEKVVLGSPVAGRDRAELEGLIGFFVNTLVLPADLSGDPTFAQLLERVREMTLAAYACQDLPFEKLVEELQPQRDRSRTPLFQVMFILQNAGDVPAAAESSPLAVSPFEVTTGTSQFDLTLVTAETPAGLWAGIEYNTDLFDAATIERLLEHYRRLLAAAVAQPDLPISALPPAPEELPQPVPEPAAAAMPQAPDVDARRDRLAARMSKLSAAQREALERRLRGGGAA